MFKANNKDPRTTSLTYFTPISYSTYHLLFVLLTNMQIFTVLMFGRCFKEVKQLRTLTNTTRARIIWVCIRDCFLHVLAGITINRSGLKNKRPTSLKGFQILTMIIVVCEGNLLMIFVQIFPKAITLTVRVKTAEKCFLGLTLLQVPQIFRT